MTTAVATAADIIDPPSWEAKGRPKLEPHQIAPEDLGRPGGPNLWLLEAGRGAGKTEACARYFTKFMRRNPDYRGRIIAPTFGDAVEACVRGPSGLLSVDPEVTWIPGADGGSKVVWPGGAEAVVLGTPFEKDVERLRALGNRHIDWWEEMAANVQLEKAWDQAAMGLRMGDYPHAIGSTTPRSTKAYKAIRSMVETVLRKATMFDNPHNPAAFIKVMKKKYEGTRLGRQELYGELLEDVVGALWTRLMIDHERVTDESLVPDMAIIVVSVDPAATSKPDSDDTGIVVCGLGVDGYGYVLEDATCHLPPNKWGHRAVDRYNKWEADYIVGETNNGGEMVEHVIATVDETVPYKGVHASRGKATRAQPIASMYGNYDDEDNSVIKEGIIRHVGGFAELEDQLVTWVPGDEDSPDRLDALVWGMTELFLTEEEGEEVVEDEYEPVKIGADV